MTNHNTDASTGLSQSFVLGQEVRIATVDDSENPQSPNMPAHMHLDKHATAPSSVLTCPYTGVSHEDSGLDVVLPADENRSDELLHQSVVLDASQCRILWNDCLHTHPSTYSCSSRTLLCSVCTNQHQLVRSDKCPLTVSLCQKSLVKGTVVMQRPQGCLL